MEKHITDCTKCDESVKNKYLLDDADNALICESDADSDDPLVECAKLGRVQFHSKQLGPVFFFVAIV